MKRREAGTDPCFTGCNLSSCNFFAMDLRNFVFENGKILQLLQLCLMSAKPLTDLSQLCIHTITTKPWNIEKAAQKDIRVEDDTVLRCQSAYLFRVVCR
jgi:hypothetical protein